MFHLGQGLDFFLNCLLFTSDITDYQGYLPRWAFWHSSTRRHRKKLHSEPERWPETRLCVRSVCSLKEKKTWKRTLLGACALTETRFSVCALYIQNTAHEYRMEFCFSCLLALECFEITWMFKLARLKNDTAVAPLGQWKIHQLFRVSSPRPLGSPYCRVLMHSSSNTMQTKLCRLKANLYQTTLKMSSL